MSPHRSAPSWVSAPRAAHPPQQISLADLDTRVGQIELAIPKLPQGSYFPGCLEPRRRAEQALVAVVQEASVNGVSTPRSTGWSSSSACTT